MNTENHHPNCRFGRDAECDCHVYDGYCWVCGAIALAGSNKCEKHYPQCRVYFKDHPGVCDLPAGHEGEHHFVSTILRNDTAGRSVEDARSDLLYRIRRSCAIPQDVDDLIAAVRADTANDDRRADCVENAVNPRCRYRGKGDPPQDCDYPECGCVDAER